MTGRKNDDLSAKVEALKKENSELKALLKEKKRKKNAEKSAAGKKDILLKLNDFSLKLAYLPANELFPFITSQIKSIFNVRAALLNTYDETTSELVLQYTTLSDKENAKLIKVLGGKLYNRRTLINKKEYKRITSKVYERISSLHELTFGAVPDLIGKAVEKLFGIDWFAALGLVHEGKLVGTMILAGDKKQNYPEKETIITFAGITANALAKKSAEEKYLTTEQRYQNIVNSSPIGKHIYELQEDDKLVFIGANPAANKILGFDHSSIIGKTIEEAFPTLIGTEVPAKYREVIKNNTVWKTEQINYKDEKVIGAFEVYAFRITENQMVARFLEITERIQKAHALMQSQENLAITLRSIGDGVISTDMLGRIANMNPVAEEMCGWKFEEAAGKPLEEVFKIIDATTKNKLNNPVEKVINTGNIVELANNTVLISKDGTERNISDSAAPIRDNENNIQGVVLVFSDVTEKYKTRETLKRSEEKFRRIIEQANEGIIITDEKGNIDTWNKSLESITGYNQKSVLGKPVWEVQFLLAPVEIKSEELFKQMKTSLLQILENNFDWPGESHEQQITCSDGKTKSVYASSFLINYGNSVRLCTIINDITERKRADEELKASQKRFEQLLQNSFDTIVLLDENGIQKYVSASAERMHGYAAEELVDIPVIDQLIHPEDQEKVRDAFRKIIETGEGGAEYRHKKKRGGWVYFEARGTNQLANPDIRGVVVNVRDITERKKFEAVLKNEKERISTILNIVTDPIFVKDDKHRFTLGNKAFFNIVGLNENEVIGKTLSENIPKKEIDNFLKIDRNVLDTGNPNISEVELTIGSQTKTIVTSKVRFTDESGEKFLVGSIHDITERKKNEEIIKESEKKYRLLFENNPQPMWVYDIETYAFLAVNDAAVLKYGYSREEFLRMTIKDIRPPEDVAKLIENVSLVTQGIENSGVWRHCKKDGSLIFVEITSYVLEFEGKKAELVLSNDITDRINAEKEKAHFNDLMKYIISNTKSSVSVFDTEMNYIYVSDRYFEDLKLTDKNIIGCNHYDIFPGLPQLFRDFHKRALNGETISGESDPLVHFDGSIDWVNWSCLPWYKADKTIGGIILYIEVITERKKAEEQIALLAQMVAIAPGGIIVHDFDGKILYANQLAAQMHGCSEEEFLSLNIRDIDTLETAELIPARMEELIKTGELNFEGRHKRKGGTSYPVQVYAKKTEWAGKPAVLSITTDITERKLAEKALLESESSFRNLFDFSPDPVWIIDGNQFVECNQAAVDILDYPNKEALKNTHPSVLSPEFQPDGESSYLKAERMMNLAQEKGLHRFEWVHTRKNGSNFLAEVTLSAISLQSRPIIHCIWRDITERKKAEEELLKSIEKTEEINANVTAIIEGTSDGIWAFDNNYNILYINNSFQKEFKEAFGVWLEKGSSLLNALPGTIRKFWKRRYEKVLSNEQFTIEDEVETANGKIYIQVTFNPIVKNGVVIGGSCFGSNITERKRDELLITKLSTSFAHLLGREFFEAVCGDAAKILGLDYLFVGKVNPDEQSVTVLGGYANGEPIKPFVYNLSGTPCNNVVGKQMCIYPNKIQQLFPQDELLQVMGVESYVGIPLFSKDSKTIGIMVGLHSNALSNLDMIQKVLTIYIDRVSAELQRTETESALRESELQFRSLYDSAADAIIIADTESGLIVNANQAAIKLINAPKESIIGMHQSQLHPPEIKEYGEAAFQKHKQEIEEMSLSNAVESIVIDSNGSRIPVEVIASKVLYQGKNCIMGIFRDITERKKAEKALKESEEQYRTLVENLNEAVMLVDLDDRVLFVNNKFTELLEYSPDEIIGKIGYEILLPKEKQNLIISAIEERKKGLSGQYEVSFVKKNGDLRHFLVNGSPVYNAEGKLTGSLGALTDITEMKQAEELQIELHRKLKTLIGNLTGIAYRCKNDKDWTMEYISEGCNKITGYTAEEFIDNKELSFNDIIHPDYKTYLWDTWQKFLSEKKHIVVEYPIITKHEGIKWVWEQGCGIFSENGELQALEGFITDITDRKRAEKVQEILYNIALHIHLEKSTKDLLEFVRSEIGYVIDTKNFFAAIYDPEKDTLKEIIYVDEIDNFESNEWSATQSISGHVVKEGKTVFLRGNEIDEFYKKHNLGVEGTIPKSWIGVPIFLHSKAIGIMVIQSYENYNAFSNSEVTLLEMIAHEIGVFIEKHTMIEELVKAKEKAEEMNKVKSHFFANMSHELRTPFVGIMGYAELLADSLQYENDRKMAEGILKASTRMQDTLANILGLSKLESDSIEVKKNKVEMNELITNLFESFKGGALRKNLSYEKEINFTELVIETDEIILKDVLQNFVSNAIKYTNEGFVKITADIEKKVENDLLVINVADSGLGIPADKLELIWEPFRQASEGLNRSFEGTGLGLSIVKKSAELLGGNVVVESEFGKGSTFKLILPITKS